MPRRDIANRQGSRHRQRWRVRAALMPTLEKRRSGSSGEMGPTRHRRMRRGRLPSLSRQAARKSAPMILAPARRGLDGRPTMVTRSCQTRRAPRGEETKRGYKRKAQPLLGAFAGATDRARTDPASTARPRRLVCWRQRPSEPGPELSINASAAKALCNLEIASESSRNGSALLMEVYISMRN